MFGRRIKARRGGSGGGDFPVIQNFGKGRSSLWRRYPFRKRGTGGVKRGKEVSSKAILANRRREFEGPTVGWGKERERA